MKHEKVHSPVLISAAEMARAHPETFDYAPKQVLDSIRPGNLIKVCDDAEPFAERFWVKITKRDGNGLFVGRVENYLFAEKPYNFGTLIRFGAENIFDFWQGSVSELHKLEELLYGAPNEVA
jgi:hypothetical protein